MAVASFNKDQQTALWRNVERLGLLQEQTIKEKSRILLELDECQAYLAAQDEVTRNLKELHERTQSETKALYEELLTALVHEVMPNKKDNRVVLSLDVKNNRPELQVDIDVNGSLQNVYMDKGGSINNIISMGLRFIVLSQTTNRRFLLFDEADAWLRTEYIPRFASIMEQLSKKLGIQVVYISHHEPSCFAGKAKIVQLLEQPGGQVKTKDITSSYDEGYTGLDEDDVIPDLMEGVGIRSIRLINYRQHKNTIIDLSKNVTSLIGDQDLGKSAVLEAFETVAKNLGRESLIRTGQDQCIVQISLEEGMTLSWTYKRKGAKKTYYCLEDAEGSVLHESNSSMGSPEWLSDYLAMDPIGDINLHFAEQFNSMFMLDKGTTAHKRAELLSIGKGSDRVSDMLIQHQQNVKKFKEANKSLSLELGRVKDRLEILRPVYQSKEDLNLAMAELEKLQEEQASLDSMMTNGQSLQLASRKVRLLHPVEQVPAIQPLPGVADLKPLEEMIQMMSEKQALVSSIGAVKKLPALDLEPVQLLDTDAIVQFGTKLNEGMLRSQLLANLPTVPSLETENNSVGELQRVISILDAAATKLGENEKARDQAVEMLNKATDEKAQLIEKLGGECPFCHSPMSSEHGYHVHDNSNEVRANG